MGLEEVTKVCDITLSFISYSRKHCTDKTHEILFLNFSLFHLFITLNAMFYTMNLSSFLKLIWLSFSQTIPPQKRPLHAMDGKSNLLWLLYWCCSCLVCLCGNSVVLAHCQFWQDMRRNFGHAGTVRKDYNTIIDARFR